VAFSAEASTPERRLGLRTLVPGRWPAWTDDRALVTLTGEQDDVAWSSAFEGSLDRGAPISDDQEIVVTAPTGSLSAACDRIVDRVAILIPGIFVGDDHEATPLARDSSHRRAFGRVPLPRRAEHGDQTAATSRGRRCEEIEHCLE